MKTPIISLLWIGLLGLVPQQVAAQRVHKSLRFGTDAYAREAYVAAEEAFRRALYEQPSAATRYNLGNAVYQQGRYTEAVKHYEEAAAATTDRAQRATAFYNLGMAHVGMKNWPAAALAFRESLKLRPNDADAKHNLTIVQRELIKQRPKPPQKQSSDSDNPLPKPREEGMPQAEEIAAFEGEQLFKQIERYQKNHIRYTGLKPSDKKGRKAW